MGLFDIFKKKTVEKEVSKSSPKVFEDFFMEVQEEMIALCLEYVKGISVDVIYAYGSIETKAASFNAFYLSEGKVLTASKIRNDVAMIKQFLRLGTDDLLRLSEVCKEHNRPVPTELRLVYNVGNKSLDTHYEYNSICNPENGILPSDVFMEWKDSVEKGM